MNISIPTIKLRRMNMAYAVGPGIIIHLRSCNGVL